VERQARSHFFGLSVLLVFTHHTTMESRMDALGKRKSRPFRTMKTARIADLTTSLNMANERIGATSQDIILQNQKTAAAIKEGADEENRSRTSTPAGIPAQSLAALRDESVAKIEEVKTNVSASRHGQQRS